MPSRRHFLATAAGASAGAVVIRSRPGLRRSPRHRDEARSNSDGTWLTYAVNVEMTWGNLPFLERLRKVKEAGFSHYEFWPWRSKDIDAIVSLNHELGLMPVQFSASPVKGFGHGITNPDPARREEFEEEIRSAVPVAKKLGVKKICVVAGEETKGLFARRADAGRHRRAQGRRQDRRARGNHDHPRAAQYPGRSSPAARRPLGARRAAFSRPSARRTSRCSSTSTTSRSARETSRATFANIMT